MLNSASLRLVSAGTLHPGSGSALDQAFRAHAPQVATMALRILGRQEEADDLVQDVFMKAGRWLSKLDDPSAVRAWLLKVTVRLAWRRLRTRRWRVAMGFAHRLLHDKAKPATPASLDELLLAADVARKSGHAADSVLYLERVLALHASDARSSVVAFTLGRVRLADLNDPAGAATAFARARAAAPQGPLAEDALAREVEARFRSGDKLRESAFIDRLGANGMKFSICEPDFSKSMESIGKALARKLLNVCFDRKLVDTDLATPGIQADCRVVYMQPVTTPAGFETYVESGTGIPQCSPGETTATATADCWQLTSDLDQCPATGQRITLVRPAAGVAVQAQLDPGIKLTMQCRTCPSLAPGSASVAGCDYWSSP